MRTRTDPFPEHKMKRVLRRLASETFRRLPDWFIRVLTWTLGPLLIWLFTRGTPLASTDATLGPRKPVSFVIPSYNDVSLLKKLLRSIRKTCKNFEYEIIISDDFCDEQNNENLQQLAAPDVRILLAEQRTGFAGAVNRGIREALHDVVILNSDIIARTGWLDALQSAAYFLDPKIGIVSPMLLYPTSLIQYGGTFHYSLAAPQWFAHLYQGRTANFQPANFGSYIRGISGACAYITREALNRIGVLDEEYWLGFEDVDYALKAWSHGFRCYYEPKAKLIHLESATRGRIQGTREFASMRRFWSKWSRSFDVLESPARYDFVLSVDASRNLATQIASLVGNLQANGREAHLHTCSSEALQNEALIEHLASVQSVKVACDQRSLETVWLSSVLDTPPVAYLPSLSGAKLDLENPEHINSLRPEFRYIFGNHQAQSTFSRSLPWQTSSIFVGPAYEPEVLPATTLSNVISVGATERQQALVSEWASHQALSFSAISVEEIANYIGTSRETLKKSLIVSFEPFDDAYWPLMFAASSQGFVGVRSQFTSSIMLDGMNCLEFDESDTERAIALLQMLASDENMRIDLKAFARKSATHFESSVVSRLEAAHAGLLSFPS